MKKTSLAALVLMLAAIGTAEAGGQEGSIGVGAEFALSSVPGSATGPSVGVGGASLNYDGGAFHVGGFLSFSDAGGDNDTNYGIGGRFFYHVHSSSMSDFGIGGTLGLISLDTPGDRASLIYLEPSAQVRLFIASNVALSFTTGIAIGLVDADGFVLGGQPTGSAGFHYYFF
jgi:hypothetical protein